MSYYDPIMRWNQGYAITCTISRRIQEYIWGYIYVEERASSERGVYMWLCGIVCVAAGERAQT